MCKICKRNTKNPSCTKTNKYKKKLIKDSTKIYLLKKYNQVIYLKPHKF